MLNSVIIMGRLTSDVELKKTPSNISVANFSVAVDRNYKSGEERQTDFINCVAWRGTADFVSTYFKKGQMIAVQGSLQTTPYTDKNGNKRTAYDVVAENVSFCGSKNDNTTPTQDEAPSFSVLPDSPASFSADDDDGLPF